MVVIDVEFAGRQMRFFEHDRQDQAARGLPNGFEAPLPMVIMAMLDRLQGTFLDVGANTGLYTVLAAKTRSEILVQAFEPLPQCIASLRQNIELNGLADRVTLHPVALSDQEGSAELFSPSDAHGLIETSASLESGFAPDRWVSSLTVKKDRLDNFRLEGTVTVIKADIEGHEASFMQGALATIRRFRPVLFVEILRNAQFDYFTQFARTHGYASFRLRPTLAIHTPEFYFDTLSWNWALIPEERLDVFGDVCRTHGLETVASLPESFFRRRPLGEQ